jgi:hypothetical protein
MFVILELNIMDAGFLSMTKNETKAVYIIANIIFHGCFFK